MEWWAKESKFIKHSRKRKEVDATQKNTSNSHRGCLQKQFKIAVKWPLVSVTEIPREFQHVADIVEPLSINTDAVSIALKS